jgi:hypothetical protein
MLSAIDIQTNANLLRRLFLKSPKSRRLLQGHDWESSADVCSSVMLCRLLALGCGWYVPRHGCRAALLPTLGPQIGLTVVVPSRTSKDGPESSHEPR